MLRIFKHTFNAFQENTFVLADETNECVIIDAGCSNEFEQNQLVQTIESNHLKPVKLLNTHCHIDHFGGNKFLCEKYNLLPEFHETEWNVMNQALDFQSFFNFSVEPSPKPKLWLKEGDEIKFGKTVLKTLFTPGHSPGSLSFYYSPPTPEGGVKNKQPNTDLDSAVKVLPFGEDLGGAVVFCGDVLFQGSVGRFDLPGASGEVLLNSIMQKLMTMPDDVKVFCGHGDDTFIGVERRTNPFLQQGAFFN